MFSESSFTKNWWICVIAVFVFTMGFDWYVHGTLMHDMYKETARLWRPEAAMKEFATWCYVKHAAIAALLVWAYDCWRCNQTMGKVGGDNCPYKKSALGFGLWVGLLLGITAAASYIYMPIPLELAQWWFGAEFLKGIGVGIVLNFAYANLCSK